MNEIQKQSNAVEKKEDKPIQLPEYSGKFECYLDVNKFNQLQRVSNLFASSDLVPQQYKGKPANCFIALQMAMRMECEPIMFMQASYVVYGKPGIEAKFAIALINTRGPFEGPVQWKMEGDGDSRKATAFAKHKKTGQVCEAVVSIDMAKKEGWYQKQGSKWQTMPDLMLQYRSAVFLGRLHCPEVLYGLQTIDEIIDVEETFTQAQENAQTNAETMAGSEAVEAEFVVDGQKQQAKQKRRRKKKVESGQKTEEPPKQETKEIVYVCERGHEFTKERAEAKYGLDKCPDCLNQNIKIKED